MLRAGCSGIFAMAFAVASCGGGDAPPGDASMSDNAAETTAVETDTAAGVKDTQTGIDSQAMTGDTASAAAGTDTTRSLPPVVSSDPGRPPVRGAGRSAVSNDTSAAGTGIVSSDPSPQDPAAALKKTASIYSAMQSMQAEFTMVTTNPLLNSTVRSHGMLYQRRPDRILLKFDDPKGDLILGDGHFFWVYYPSVDAKQVTKTAAANGAGVVDLQAQFVGDPLTRFNHTMEGHESVDGRDALMLTLIPRDDVGYRVLKIWIDSKDSLVRRFEVTDNNRIIRRLDLKDLAVNPALADSLFRFTPPAGVNVVERG
jgi:outer membrane lipoprotein carrier protein